MIKIIREVYDTPASVTERLVLAGGLNPFGEPNYRAIWGWKRLDWIGGKWEDRDADGKLIREVVELRREPKYPQVNRWHIEKWLPAAKYGSPQEWWAQTFERENGVKVPALGPYPYEGDYELSFTLEERDGGFLQLTPTAAEYIANAIERSRHLDRVKRRTALNESKAREENAAVDEDYAILDDAVGAFHEQPFVTVQGE